MIHAVYLSIIAILLIIMGWLMDILNEETERNRKYFKELRREYDIKMSELRKDNEILNEIVGGYLNG